MVTLVTMELQKPSIPLLECGKVYKTQQFSIHVQYHLIYN